MLGLASRQFEVALSGAVVTKGGDRRERAAEKEKEKKGGLPNDMPLARRGRVGV